MMIYDHLDKTRFSRRRFIQAMAGASLASMGGVLPDMQASATSVLNREVPLPKFID